MGRSGVMSLGIDLRKRPPVLAKALGEYIRRPDPKLRSKIEEDPKLRSKIEEMCGGFTYGLYRRGL